MAFLLEGFLPTVALSLAIAVQRMIRHNALLRRLSVVESLNASVICTDETGTLTPNAMTMRSLWISDQSFAVTGVKYNPEGTVELVVEEEKAQAQVRLLLVVGPLWSNAR